MDYTKIFPFDIVEAKRVRSRVALGNGDIQIYRNGFSLIGKGKLIDVVTSDKDALANLHLLVGEHNRIDQVVGLFDLSVGKLHLQIPDQFRLFLAQPCLQQLIHRNQPVISTVDIFELGFYLPRIAY